MSNSPNGWRLGKAGEPHLAEPFGDETLQKRFHADLLAPDCALERAGAAVRRHCSAMTL